MFHSCLHCFVWQRFGKFDGSFPGKSGGSGASDEAKRSGSDPETARERYGDNPSFCRRGARFTAATEDQLWDLTITTDLTSVAKQNNGPRETS